ncbi:MAG: hypothetical protein AB1384_06385 [Actinomycetota bacterium]
MNISLCPECGVPEQITTNYQWLNSGVMVQRNDISRRVGFLESENLDPLYTGIGKIIGMPIDRLVIDISRRGTVEYFNTLIPPEARGMVRGESLGPDSVAAFMTTTGQLNGFGKYEIVDIRYIGNADDHTVINVSEPFSLLLIAGTQAGGCEVVSGSPHEASFREVSPGVYEVTATVSSRDERLDERMPIKEYRHREGDIELEKCATCGGPVALAGFRWLLDRGIISNVHTRRRMAMMGPEVQDPLFEELERELGDTVPAVVVEAQRRFVKTGFYSIEEIGDEGDFRTQLALRGFGNLREISVRARGMRMRVDNAACYLMTAGIAQGLFEMAFDVDSYVEWELSRDGDLEIEVTPHGVKQTVEV